MLSVIERTEDNSLALRKELVIGLSPNLAAILGISPLRWKETALNIQFITFLKVPVFNFAGINKLSEMNFKLLILYYIILTYSNHH